MSSKCFESGLGAESEDPPHEAMRDNTLTARSFDRVRIGEPEPTTGGHGELPSEPE
jgi:hypothetical protein